MLNRKLSFVVLLLGVYGCSSSTVTPPVDSGTKNEAGGDTAVTEGGGDAHGDATTDQTTDQATDTATSDAGDAALDAAGDATDALTLTPAQARGAYLVNHVAACPDCHTPMKADGTPDLTKFLAGNANFVVTPGGNLPTRNLTNDATGLKTRTDAEIKNMFRNGLRPTATGMEALNPIMPYYVFHNMSDDDADAIVAYLRTVPGVNNEIPRRAAMFDVTAPANYIDANKIPLPVPGFVEIESALRGRYLASKAGVCIECHTQHQMAADVLDATKFFSGGEDFSDFFAATIMIHPVSKNLTSDTATGLGTWTAADIVKVLKQGKAKDGTGICPPMPVGPMGAFGDLTDDDALDIANYIKSLPPIVHAIVDMCVFPLPMPADGGTDAVSSDASDAGSDAGSSDATGN